jgi:predicted regulator of Ras-like GTPase activity (Roadblock/LC7/MglB family)
VKRVLDPLAQVPGLRRAALISKDGVPITHIQTARGASPSEARPWSDSAEDLSAFAGMAAGILAEIHRSVDPLSWDAPHRVVLRAARGTLILLVTERATIAVELERGMAPEDVRLPMESAAARLLRALARRPQAGPLPKHVDEPEGPPGPFPGEVKERGDPPGMRASTGNEVPEITTES